MNKKLKEKIYFEETQNDLFDMFKIKQNNNYYTC